MVKDGISPERDERAEHHRRERVKPHFSQTRDRDGGAAFEADGDEQIDGEPGRQGLGKFQVALRQRGDDAQHEKEDGGREQVGLDGGENVCEQFKRDWPRRLAAAWPAAGLFAATAGTR